MMDPTSLEGKLVLVTGAGTGIGQGVALELARRGADVVLHYSSSAAGANAAVEQIVATGRRAAAFQGDLAKVEDCRRVVDQAAAFLGGLDGLVSNAGITATYDFLDVTPEQFDRLYHVNIRGQFFCAQQAVPYAGARPDLCGAASWGAVGRGQHRQCLVGTCHRGAAWALDLCRDEGCHQLL